MGSSKSDIGFEKYVSDEVIFNSGYRTILSFIIEHKENSWGDSEIAKMHRHYLDIIFPLNYPKLSIEVYHISVEVTPQ